MISRKKELDGLSPEQSIKKLKTILHEELGLPPGRISMAQCKQIKEKREAEADLRELIASNPMMDEDNESEDETNDSLISIKTRSQRVKKLEPKKKARIAKQIEDDEEDEKDNENSGYQRIPDLSQFADSESE